MVRFLSPEWLHEIDRVAGSAGPCASELDGFVVGYHVDDIDYHVAFTSEGMRVVPGVSEAATVTLHLDRATAAAIARGELNAQRAFMSGRLRIGGDVTALVRAHAAVAALGDVFAQLRPETEW